MTTYGKACGVEGCDTTYTKHYLDLTKEAKIYLCPHHEDDWLDYLHWKVQERLKIEEK